MVWATRRQAYTFLPEFGQGLFPPKVRRRWRQLVCALLQDYLTLPRRSEVDQGNLIGVGVETKSLDDLCINAIRALSMDAVQKANSGHPGLPRGAAPMAYTLWTKYLRHNPSNPH